MRTQEALQLDWRWVDFNRGTLNLPTGETKSSKARSVPMHPRMDLQLFELWCVAGRPRLGKVFLSSRGAPYSDTRTRAVGQPGGNPLARAHRTACRRAGVTGFRVHDWRHDWATRIVWAGTDLPTLMQLGGSASLQMVQRYAATSSNRMAEAIRRLA
jgi:integrase